MFHTSRRAAVRHLVQVVLLGLSLSTLVVIMLAGVIAKSNVVYHEHAMMEPMR